MNQFVIMMLLAALALFTGAMLGISTVADRCERSGGFSIGTRFFKCDRIEPKATIKTGKLVL